MKIPLKNSIGLAFGTGLALALGLTGCKPSSQSSSSGGPSSGGGSPSASASSGAKTTIQNLGSDTLVNVAQSWAEEYRKVKPNVSVEVAGGGSGVGIAGLINGTIDIANASRAMKPEELQKAKANSGKDAKEHVVGYDALAVYVHKENPLNEITLEQLGQIYGEKGTITKWSQLGVKVPGCDSDEVIRVSRQSNSGTYEFFREATLGKGDFKLGSRDQQGSKDVVELVSHTPCAIGYSGMGYATPSVKMLKVATKAGQPFYPPSVETTLAKTYPIARPLFMYTLGEPTGEVKQYLDWIHGDQGQKILADIGYVPLPKK